MNQITKNLAFEWAMDNIRVNTIAPWMIRTSLVDDLEVKSEFPPLLFIEHVHIYVFSIRKQKIKGLS